MTKCFRFVGGALSADTMHYSLFILFVDPVHFWFNIVLVVASLLVWA